ncbi:GYDIA family GHMP kinase [Seonamhaeicola sp. ML3]|uniref:GYDIA family GHMP kinase n=1 Tax=Seonamhaeicola sp. ML3 TaxID=2937786 RepID=UPI00200FEDA3|nr:GYDIA family GHMP kinase [Seonamhaeicola sp. ML3]
MKHYFSHGKLLITGEYLVLDGAQALAIPTKYGQSLEIETIPESSIYWESIDLNGSIWFKTEIKIAPNGDLKSAQNDVVTERLIEIFNAIKTQKPDFFGIEGGYSIKTVLDFPKNWGLGTSSTLINNLSNWADINAFKLLDLTFGGSGYDIACAQNDGPIIYKTIPKGQPEVETTPFNPIFKEDLYFIHLNKKQNSRDGIAYYRAQQKEALKDVILEINAITSKMVSCRDLNEFQDLMDKHETIIANITNQTPVKEQLFKDFNGSIKSLGAWGGDFIMAACDTNPTNYFTNKGFETIIPYSAMVL